MTVQEKILLDKGDFNWSLYINHKWNVDSRFPSTFTKYRFGGSFAKLEDYVHGRDTYKGEFDKPKPNYLLHTTPEKEYDHSRIKYINKHFIEGDGYDQWRKGLKVVSIELTGVEDVYDLTVEDNHNFYIITSTDDDKYLNCQGILVHNCSEIMLPSTDDESFICCLSSLNLELYDEWKDTNTVKNLVYLLDSLLTEFIDKSKGRYGLDQVRKFAERHRAIGIGVLGYHSYLQKNMIPFESMEAKMFNSRVFKDIKTRAEKASKELAKIYGEPELLKGYKMRNTTLLAIAPTTSSSSILGQVSPGIEPYVSNYYKAGLAKGNFMRKNKYLAQLLSDKGLDNEDTWRSIMMNKGSVSHMTELSDLEKDVFKTFREISPMEIVTQAAQRQQFIDQGQSLNLMIPSDMPLKDVNKIYIEAWKLGIKTLYYQRSSSVSKEMMVNFVNCASCES
jgi:ribonucleotide reductase alpha subunit